jgi:hypothetical protein
MPRRPATLELFVVQCPGGRGHCRVPARPGHIVLTRHRGPRPAVVRLDCGPGVALSAIGLERAHELAACYLVCRWTVESTVAGSHLRFNLQPPRSRYAALDAILDVVADDLLRLARLHVVAMPDEHSA